MFAEFKISDEQEKFVRSFKKNSRIRKKHLRKIDKTTNTKFIKLGEKKGGEFMKTEENKALLKTLGGILLDLAAVKSQVVLPSDGPEILSLAGQLLEAKSNRVAIPIYTPFCPDWSRDESGRYDFRSLGGGMSFIADKFFRHAPTLLEIFVKHQIPFDGYLIFANWGLETEINAQDTYGRKLSKEDVKMCFASTQAVADERLLTLQQEAKTSKMFSSYRVITMTEFYRERNFDPQKGYEKAVSFFTSDKKGQQLVGSLNDASYEPNRKRLGLNREENYAQGRQNLSEYATLGESFGNRGLIVAAESQTSTRAYNIIRSKNNKLPTFFLKGEGKADLGVNIL